MPEGMTPLLADIYPEPAMKGFRETLARYGALLDCLAFASVNGFIYQQPQPFDMPGPDGPPSPEWIGAEIGRRAEVAAAALENRIWRDNIDRWDAELKPAAIARHRELGDVVVADLDDAELGAHIAECMDQLEAMVYQHHRFNVSALLPVGDLALQGSALLGRPPTDFFSLLNGHSPASGVHCPEILPAVDALRADPDAIELLRSNADAGETLTTLRARVPAVDEFVRSVGFRLLDGFDVSSPTALEHPGTILGRLSTALTADPEEARASADAIAEEYRSQLDDEDRERFDALLAEARYVYRLRDERGLYSDISATGILRLALLDLGRRMVAAGDLDDATHLFELGAAELRQALTGGGWPSAADFASRAEARRALVTAGAPRLLGPPPPPPPPLEELPPPLARVMGGVGFAIEGILGQLEESAGDETSVGGIGANPGVYEGRVHLVRTLDDLWSIEEGDVLVTRATGEAFNAMIHLVGAIVTDHGSFASHAAIIARECGFPAVVGCVDATARIEHGQRVRVDGGEGLVTLL